MPRRPAPGKRCPVTRTPDRDNPLIAIAVDANMLTSADSRNRKGEESVSNTRIGVVADTHLKSFATLQPKMLEVLSGVDLIVHAGDIVAQNVLDGLRNLKEVKAVRGNMDRYELTEMLPEKEVLVLGGKRIGITHGSGSPDGLVERVRKMFDDVDVIIYGHSHMSQNEVIDGILFFNPGDGRRSFGLLTIGEDIKGQIIAP